jgi:hypothetical protein
MHPSLIQHHYEPRLPQLVDGENFSHIHLLSDDAFLNKAPHHLVN